MDTNLDVEKQEKRYLARKRVHAKNLAFKNDKLGPNVYIGPAAVYAHEIMPKVKAVDCVAQHILNSTRLQDMLVPELDPKKASDKSAIGKAYRTTAFKINKLPSSDTQESAFKKLNSAYNRYKSSLKPIHSISF
jgi:hypothetical protein